MYVFVCVMVKGCELGLRGWITFVLTVTTPAFCFLTTLWSLRTRHLNNVKVGPDKMF